MLIVQFLNISWSEEESIQQLIHLLLHLFNSFFSPTYQNSKQRWSIRWVWLFWAALKVFLCLRLLYKITKSGKNYKNLETVKTTLFFSMWPTRTVTDLIRLYGPGRWPNHHYLFRGLKYETPVLLLILPLFEVGNVSQNMITSPQNYRPAKLRYFPCTFAASAFDSSIFFGFCEKKYNCFKHARDSYIKLTMLLHM